MSKTIYVLDRYTNKNIAVDNVSDEVLDNLKAWDKIVYVMDDQQGKPTIWTYVGHNLTTDRKGRFQRMLEWEDKEYFEEQHKFVLEIFPLFKKKFKKAFVGSVPITAKFHIFADQIYFYFYAEERYVFTDFVRELRQKLGKNIFLFQVWARDMIRLSPGADNIAGCNGLNLCCKSTRDLPSVEMENIILQNLEWRDVERLKGRCGKLKCCLVHELELYTQESEKYPEKWSCVACKGNDQCGIVTSFNIMTWDVTIRTEKWDMFRLPVSQLKKTNKKIVLDKDKKDKASNDKNEQEVK